MTMPFAPVANSHSARGCWWAFRRGLRPMPLRSWLCVPRIVAKILLSCCPTPVNATCRPYSMPLRSTLFSGKGAVEFLFFPAILLLGVESAHIRIYKLEKCFALVEHSL